MSTLETTVEVTDKEKLDIADLKVRLDEGLKAGFTAAWSACTEAAIAAVEHCLGNKSHSPDIIHYVGERIRHHGDGGGIYLKCYVRAVRLIVAREMDFDGKKGKYSSKYHKDEWAYIKAHEFPYLQQLKNDGLASFKPPKQEATSKKEFQKVCTKISKTLKEIDDEFEGQIDLSAFENKLVNLLNEVQRFKTELPAKLLRPTPKDDTANNSGESETKKEVKPIGSMSFDEIKAEITELEELEAIGFDEADPEDAAMKSRLMKLRYYEKKKAA